MAELGLLILPFAIGVLLRHWARGRTVADVIVFHESVTASRAKTCEVLTKRGLSAHVIVDRDGSITQHAPIDRQCAHAGRVYNRRSVAIEVVNRYYGSQADDGEPDIQAVWAHRGWYVLPTPAQLESVWTVVLELTARLPIPLVFPATPDVGRGFRWGRFPWASRLLLRRRPGLVAHHRVDHADGLFVEHYVLLRSLGWGPGEAFEHSVHAASSGARVTPVPLPVARAA